SHRAVDVLEARSAHPSIVAGCMMERTAATVRSMTGLTRHRPMASRNGTDLPLGRRRHTSPTLSLAIVCAGVVLASLDLFIVNVALPGMQRELGGDLSSLSWVLNAYAIVYAALLVLLGRVADRYDRRTGFLIGVAVFTAASA